MEATTRPRRDRVFHGSRNWLEAAAAVAIVVAVVGLLALVRGGAGIAPADVPDATSPVLFDAARATEAPAVPSVSATGDALDPSGDPDADVNMNAPAGPEDATPPTPDDGTRLYPSIAALLADPQPAGETVWVDAYDHGISTRLKPQVQPRSSIARLMASAIGSMSSRFVDCIARVSPDALPRLRLCTVFGDRHHREPRAAVTRPPISIPFPPSSMPRSPAMAASAPAASSSRAHPMFGGVADMLTADALAMANVRPAN